LGQALTLVKGAADGIADALAEKLVPSHELVKITICLIGTHYRARQLATSRGSRAEMEGARHRSAKAETEEVRQLAKETALAAVTIHFTALCGQAIWELSHYDAPSPQVVRGHPAEFETSTNRGDTHSPNDKADIEGLALQLSSIIRRMLPSMRILSKWLKCNVGYLRRHVDRSKLGEVNRLWSEYVKFVTKVAEMFPIYNLPSMMGSLEEDIELRGFLPLSRAFTDAKRFEARNSDEEHLMRVSDLSIDAVLIVQQGVSLCVLFDQKM
jgi:hypothetical protein